MRKESEERNLILGFRVIQGVREEYKETNTKNTEGGDPAIIMINIYIITLVSFPLTR